MNILKRFYHAYWSKPVDTAVETISTPDGVIQYFNNGAAAWKAIRNKPNNYKSGYGGRMFGNLHQIVYENGS